MRRALALAVLIALASAPALGQSQFPTGWNGANPFQCDLQQAGFEETGPNPEADPYCVEFDKRRQNVTEGGFVDFLAKEPGRVAAASPKCFYFQSDHWRGSVVQDDGSTKTYEWDGHYFFDKARAEGGVWVTNFNVNGRTGDPSAIPGMPPEWAQHFGPGTGGMITRNSVEGDPECARRAREEGDRIYADPRDAPGGGGPEAGRERCATPGRVTSRSLGPVALRDTEGAVRERLGAPAEVHRGTLRWCTSGGGTFVAGERGDRSGDLGSDPDARVVVLLSTDPGFRLHRVGPGSSARALRRAFPRRRRLGTLRGTHVVLIRRGASVLFGHRRGRVRFVAVYDRRSLRTRRGLRMLLDRSRSGG
jgi:hypothetical protein